MKLENREKDQIQCRKEKTIIFRNDDKIIETRILSNFFLWEIKGKSMSKTEEKNKQENKKKLKRGRENENDREEKIILEI